MAEKRLYPLFLIDRSRNAYPYDFVLCTHQTCGFIAKGIYFFDDNVYQKFIEEKNKVANSHFVHVSKKLNTGGVVLLIEEFLFSFDENNPKHIPKVQSLLKRGLKAYLHGEANKTPHKDFGIDNQILFQEVTIERAKSNYNAMLMSMTKENADYNIQLADAMLETLKKYRDMVGRG
ncbi:MAG: hypothetical protein ACK5MK_06980 [Dysgonomonas sp.]